MNPLHMWFLIATTTTISILFLPDSPVFSSINLLPFIPFILLLPIYAFFHHRQAPKPTTDINKLITTGPYRFIRHPFYAADIMIAIVVAITFPRIDILTAAAIASTIFILWAKREERVLEKRFPEYKAYKQQTGMFFPKF